MLAKKAFVICLYIFSAAHGARTGKRACIEDLKNVTTVQLRCSDGERIHIAQELYGDGDYATCLKSECKKKLTSNQEGLIVNCNGKQSCHETMNKQSFNNCHITKAAGEVEYNCIKRSMNMCSPVTTTVNGSVYLHSPGFPDSVGVNSSCVARITGQTLQVTLVEQYQKSGTLNISGDGRQLWTYMNMDQYNRVLPGQAAEIIIAYDNHDQGRSNVWIRVTDSGQMNITISSERLDASSTTTETTTTTTTTTTTSTQRVSSSQTTSGPGTSDTPTTETTRAHSTSTVAASMTTVTSTGGLTTHLTGNTATLRPSKSTKVSTAVSTTNKIITTNMTTKDGKASSTITPSPEQEMIILVASAVSGCVVTILIVVIAVVLCRKHMKKSRCLETPGNGDFKRPLELSPMNPEKHQNGLGQNETCNQYVVVDPEFVAGRGLPINTESGHRTVSSGNNGHDLYANAVPFGSAVDMCDKSTFTVTNSAADNGASNVTSDPNGSRVDSDHQETCAMTENDLYDRGFADLREAMVDNVVYDKFDLEKEKESVQDECHTSPNNTKQALANNCEMIGNDVYVGSRHAANENNEDDLKDGGLETSEGMADNGLYDKFDFDRTKESLKDEADASPNHGKLASKKDGMVENDVYERGPSHLGDPVGSVADTANTVGALYDGGLETSEGMVDNGLYDTFDFDRTKESLKDEVDASPNHGKLARKDGMVENDVYERGLSHLGDPVGSVADTDNHVGALYDGGVETSF